MKAFIHHKKDGSINIGNNGDPDFIVIMKKSEDACYALMDAEYDQNLPVNYNVSLAKFVSEEDFDKIKNMQ